MNSTILLIGAIVLVVILMALWARSRTERIRADAEARERRAIAAVRAGGDSVTEGSEDAEGFAKPAESTGETIFEPGMPTSMVPGNRGSIEVAEVLDIEELLRDESLHVAERARAQLEEATNISLGDTLPPRPVASAPAAFAPPAAAVRAAAPAMPPARPGPAVQTAPAAVPAGAAGARAASAVAAATASAAHPPGSRQVSGVTARSPAPAQAPSAAVAPAPVAIAPAATAAPDTAERLPVRNRAASAGAPAALDGDAPLRELVLAWFEARGYRSAPASPVVRPIELVLRHKDDPSRAYAFVVGTQRITSERVQQLAQQARGIGLIRLLIVADAGTTNDAPTAKKGVRVLDRTALGAELAKLDISVAAKIIAVARKRAATRAASVS